MILQSVAILNYKNIREANLLFSDKINCFVGLNGQGKTNLLDAIYLLSFTKSFSNAIDSQNITHNELFCMVQGTYLSPEGDDLQISCGIKRGVKKQFRRGKKDYQRLIDHIGLIPLVIVSPQDSQLIDEGSDERRRFMDSVISQQNKAYLEHLTAYNTLLKQRNALLKQYEDTPDSLPSDLMDILEEQLTQHALFIYDERNRFVTLFTPLFQSLYAEIAGDEEHVTLTYSSQLHERDLAESLRKTRQRDLILGWTSQGIHKDELEMHLLAGNGEAYPLKRVGSQGQQKTFLLAMKLAQALFLGKPILLLDDIFDKLDSTRVEHIVSLLQSERFGQIFITDTDRQHLTDILRLSTDNSRIFQVSNGIITLD